MSQAQQVKPPLSETEHWELSQIRATLRLAAFAVEAERVLRDLENGARRDPNMGRLLDAWTEQRLQWTEYAGAAPLVLDGLYCRLGVMLDLEG
ncbi:hypothetical protein [Hydrogenophaga atypica]|uniref:Uncharacterized protein n=1 Tax=Hydrogenophaga atypica TaxID=249409 RepID=A0ABW2QIQ4_9BURK